MSTTVSPIPSRPDLVDVWSAMGQPSPTPPRDWYEQTQVGQKALLAAASISPSLHEDLHHAANLRVHVCRDGVNRAMERFSGSDSVIAPNGKTHFLIADGTGTGKGFQVMLTSAMMAEKTGKPSLVATRPDLVHGLLRDAAKLGIPADQHQVEVVGYDRLAGHLEEAKESGRKYAILALDEAQDVAASPTLRRLTDQFPSDHVLFLSATPYVHRRDAVYFLSRLRGQPESAIENELGKDLQSTVQGIEKINRELYTRGALVRREFPFWGKLGEIQVHAPTNSFRAEETRLQQTYLQRFREVQSPRELLHTQQQFDQEIRSLSDEALIEPVCEEITKLVKSGQKVVFYGTDGSSPINHPDANSSLVLRPGLLTGVQEGLKRRGIVAAKLTGEPSTSEKNRSDVLLRNSMEANRFVDTVVLDVFGEPMLNDRGEHRVRSECDVILLPPSQSAGWSQFCQQYPSGKPVTVLSSLPERADDLQQQEGRVSRISSQGPAQAKIICLCSQADQERIQQIALGNSFLQANGSLWVQAHEGMIENYQTQVRQLAPGKNHTPSKSHEPMPSKKRPFPLPSRQIAMESRRSLSSSINRA